MISDWYKCVEEPIRELVHILRNNGFNTECSCGHEMYIQCQYILDGTLMKLHNLIYCYMSEHNMPINYKIEVIITITDGHQYPRLAIYLKKNCD